MIKNIIFDLNKVLVTYKDIDKKYSGVLGISQNKFWEPAKKFFGDHVTGKIDADYFLLKLLEENKLDKCNFLEVKKLYFNNISNIPGMNNLLNSLKNNYLLFLAAGDGPGSLEMKLEKFNLSQYFKNIYATCYLGLIKTDTNFYKEILSRESLIPKETLFIDDRKPHLDAAEKLGINILLFKNASKLKRDLKKDFNILF